MLKFKKCHYFYCSNKNSYYLCIVIVFVTKSGEFVTSYLLDIKASFLAYQIYRL